MQLVRLHKCCWVWIYSVHSMSAWPATTCSRDQAANAAGAQLHSQMTGATCDNNILRMLKGSTLGHAHRWLLGEIDGPGKWKKPHLDQCHLCLIKLTYKGHLWPRLLAVLCPGSDCRIQRNGPEKEETRNPSGAKQVHSST